MEHLETPMLCAKYPEGSLDHERVGASEEIG
jgi:hypothetical protein